MVMTSHKKGEISSRSLKGRLALISLVALAVTGGGAMGMYRLFPAKRTGGQVIPPAPVNPARPLVEQKSEIGKPGRPIKDDEPAFWSEVEVYKAVPGRPRPIVVVKRGKQPTEGQIKGLYQGLLAREIVRQGLMLSAREELGAVTRDVPIGDAAIEGKPDANFRIGSRFRLHFQSSATDPPVGRITLVDGAGANRRVILSREFECGIIVAPEYAKLVELVEILSRNEFRRVFEELGLQRNEPARKASGAEGVSGQVEARLERLVETEQFAAIRELHAAIRSRGETPALLRALSRAYANLGSLSESQWTPDYLAFEARALLYAQRAFVLDQGTSASRWARAYAEAVTGLFERALDDLGNADKADDGKDALPWVKVIRAYCHSDGGALDALVKNQPDDPLPLYFRFLTRLHSSGLRYDNWDYKICREEIITAGRALLRKVPDCYRVHDGMAGTEGVANLHQTTTVGFELFATAVPRRVSALPGLPAAVARLVKDVKVPDEVELRRQLTAAAADDPSDLTWGVLARQFREIRFLQVCRRLHFLAYSLAVPPGEFASDALPLLADHPYRAYVAYFAKRSGPEQTVKMYKSLDFSDIERRAETLFFPLTNIDPALRSAFVAFDFAHVSLGTVSGQESRTSSGKPSDMAHAAHNLLRYSPDSPLGRGALIETNWEEARPHVEAWENDHGGDTLVLAQLGFHWLEEGEFDKAERLFEQALAKSHDGWIFKGLATSYRTSGRIDRWTKALDDFLKTEDLALDHAHALEDLAKYLMEQKEYKKARPYAELAAQSWAGWAMISAARCADEMKDWEAAERWVSRTSERYPIDWLDWIYWCKRTGRGNAKAATAVVLSQLEAGREPSSDDEVEKVTVVLILDNRPKEARKILEPLYKEKHGTLIGVFLALACDMDGDAVARDAVLKAVRDEPKPKAPKVAELFGVLGEWLANGEKSPLDLKRLDPMFESLAAYNRASSYVFAGAFLDRHGKPDVALDYLKRANVKECPPWFRLIATDALRARGVDPGIIPW
jgi:tetratricopeptide (TPR) repeat protein